MRLQLLRQERQGACLPMPRVGRISICRIPFRRIPILGLGLRLGIRVRDRVRVSVRVRVRVKVRVRVRVRRFGIGRIEIRRNEKEPLSDNKPTITVLLPSICSVQFKRRHTLYYVTIPIERVLDRGRRVYCITWPNFVTVFVT